MSSDSHSQCFSVKDLPTRSVTVNPATAAVVRDIPNISLRPGTNVYTVTDISPSAHPSSFRVSGHGTSALITDTSVELVPAAPHDDDDDGRSLADDPEIRDLDRRLAELQVSRDWIAWRIQTIHTKVGVLEKYGHSLAEPSPATDAERSARVLPAAQHVLDFLSKYAEVRNNAGGELLELASDQRDAEDAFRALNKEYAERKAEIALEQQRRERAKQGAWSPFGLPRVYRLTVTVECGSLPADAPSIAASVDTGKPREAVDDAPPPGDGPSLRISYVVRGASWLPRYELRLDTVERSALLTYRAEVTNDSNEAWADATVTLSTAQSGFSGPGQRPPTLETWKVGLAGEGDDVDADVLLRPLSRLPAAPKQPARSLFGPAPAAGRASAPSNTGGLFGNARPRAASDGDPFDAAALPSFGLSGITPHPAAPTGGLFGHRTSTFQPAQTGPPTPFAHPVPATTGAGSGTATVPPVPGTSLFANAFNATGPGTSAAQSPPGSAFGASTTQPASSGGLFGSSTATPAPSGSLFGSSTTARPSAGGLFGSTSGAAPSASLFGSTAPPASTGAGLFGGSSAAPAAEDALTPLRAATAVTASYGITTTFALPGKRTLTSSTTSKNLILREVSLEDVSFTYVCVPRHRAAVFVSLSAKLPPSAPPVLAETNRKLLLAEVHTTTGLTIDGTFLDRLTIPRTVPPGGTIRLDLGVEERLLVTVPQQTIARRAEGGAFFGQSTAITKVRREWEIASELPSTVRVVVKDQYPESVDGDAVGVKVIEPQEEEKDAVVEKGVVRWDVDVEKGETVKRGMEYEVRVKASDKVKRVE